MIAFGKNDDARRLPAFFPFQDMLLCQIGSDLSGNMQNKVSSVFKTPVKFL
jgi:hypothetical protein